MGVYFTVNYPIIVKQFISVAFFHIILYPVSHKPLVSNYSCGIEQLCYNTTVALLHLTNLIFPRSNWN
jgi:hypothetical protein